MPFVVWGRGQEERIRGFHKRIPTRYLKAELTAEKEVNESGEQDCAAVGHIRTPDGRR